MLPWPWNAPNTEEVKCHLKTQEFNGKRGRYRRSRGRRIPCIFGLHFSCSLQGQRGGSIFGFTVERDLNYVLEGGASSEANCSIIFGKIKALHEMLPANECKFSQIREFCGIVFPTKVAISKAITRIWDNIADIRGISKDFGLMREERKTEINMKTECRKNGPIICKDLHSSSYQHWKIERRRNHGPRSCLRLKDWNYVWFWSIIEGLFLETTAHNWDVWA